MGKTVLGWTCWLALAATATTLLGCAADAQDGTLTTRYDNAIAQTTWTEAGDLHTVLVDSATKSQLATMDWSNDASRLSWKVSDRVSGAEPMSKGPHVGDMNRAVFRLYQSAWADANTTVKPSF